MIVMCAKKSRPCQEYLDFKSADDAPAAGSAEFGKTVLSSAFNWMHSLLLSVLLFLMIRISLFFSVCASLWLSLINLPCLPCLLDANEWHSFIDWHSLEAHECPFLLEKRTNWNRCQRNLMFIYHATSLIVFCKYCKLDPIEISRFPKGCNYLIIPIR